MSNVISIKTGTGAPTTSDLVVGELGFDLTNNILYIGKSDSVWGINIFNNIIPGGVLPIANGGTGQTTATDIRNMLGLGNTTGALPIANGGTGQTTVAAARNAFGLGNTTGALPIANGGTGQTTAAGIRNILGLGNTTGALPIANGGTGQTTATGIRNTLGLGNTTGALPIANGGTGQTTAAGVRNTLGLGNTTGALPLANGGTGKTNAYDARHNIGIEFRTIRNLATLGISSPPTINQIFTAMQSGDTAIIDSSSLAAGQTPPNATLGYIEIVKLNGARSSCIFRGKDTYDARKFVNGAGSAFDGGWQKIHIGETIVTTPAVTPSIGSLVFFYCCKVGRVVTFNMRLTSAAFPSTGTTSLGNIIPTGYRPMSGDTALSVYTGNDTNISQGWVGTAGNVSVRLSSTTTGINLIISGSWVVPD